jgi:deoxyribonucleoside regulator
VEGHRLTTRGRGTRGPATADRRATAVTVARMYYGAGQSTQEIATYLRVSRSTVSRLLSYARDTGIVEVRVHDAEDHVSGLTAGLAARFPRTRFHVLGVNPAATGGRVNTALAQYGAHAVAAMVEPGMTVGVACGSTVGSLVDHLPPRPVADLRVVQLTGVGPGDIVVRFAETFAASHFLFPVPAFFDRAETREALWKERSIRRILDLQESADLLLFSIGDPGDGPAGLVGEIGTVFFDGRGSGDLEINRRSSGPPLSQYTRSRHSVCVVSDVRKVPGLAAALSAGLISDLIVDSRTARELVQRLPGGVQSSSSTAE